MPVDVVWRTTYGRGSSANSAMSADSASDRGARSATRCPVGVWDDVVTGTSPSMGLIGVAESLGRQAGQSGRPFGVDGVRQPQPPTSPQPASREPRRTRTEAAPATPPPAQAPQPPTGPPAP